MSIFILLDKRVRHCPQPLPIGLAKFAESVSIVSDGDREWVLSYLDRVPITKQCAVTYTSEPIRAALIHMKVSEPSKEHAQVSEPIKE